MPITVFDALKARLRAFRSAGRDTPAPLTLRELEGRLRALEEAHAVREIQWAETRQALDRMLRRAAALQQRQLDQDEQGTGNGRKSREQLLATLRAKGLLKGE